MIRVGVIGCGYWGPNLIRNLMETDDAWVSHLCDLDENLLATLKRRYPSLQTTRDYKSILKSSEIDAVAIVTPVKTHYKLAKEALECGKHVLVEKPLAQTSKEAECLVELAKKKNLCLMVDHTFIYSGPIRALKDNIHRIGQLRYFDSVRVNLGLFQNDINVIWDLAPHDLSILAYITNDEPEQISAMGVSHIKEGIENTAYMTMKYRNNFMAHFHFNWLSPVKVRRTIVSGSKKMMIYNDLDPSEPLKIYDHGVQRQEARDKSVLIEYRTGDVYSPQITKTEALRNVCKDFVDSINLGRAPVSDGEFGLRLVRILEASQKSIKRSGGFVRIL